MILVHQINLQTDENMHMLNF